MGQLDLKDRAEEELEGRWVPLRPPFGWTVLEFFFLSSLLLFLIICSTRPQGAERPAGCL